MAPPDPTRLLALAEVEALRLDLIEQSRLATEAARKSGIALHPRIAALRARAEASDAE